ncbi:MAG TPA: zf-TFIIB domain-containing protein, partial [Candidatus Methylomirabilis sp.]|nr:zf-TFIIB domain-containing protein [Candidatus Methylomirabilis sp.]
MASGEVEVDRCRTCGAAWFDPGEIRELTQGRLPVGEDPPPAGFSAPLPREEKRAALRRAWGEAAGLSCPRCGEPLRPFDFELTGVPVFRCGGCAGILVPGRSATFLSARYKFQRDHAALYAALGTTMAKEIRRQVIGRVGNIDGSASPGKLPVPGLPVLVPLADKSPAPVLPPLVVYGILLLTVVLYLFAWIGVGGMGGLSGRLALPSGAGFSGVPKFTLLLTPFLHGGIVPLAVGCLFLFVLGDNVE